MNNILKEYIRDKKLELDDNYSIMILYQLFQFLKMKIIIKKVIMEYFVLF